LVEGKIEDALREADSGAELAKEAYFYAQQAIVYGSAGSTAKAREILSNLLGGNYPGYAAPGWIGAVYYSMGEMDDGYKWMTKSFEARDPTIPWTNKWPVMEPARKDPRFLEILRKAKLP
jgi:tetratricopeptide (TPR) repeat protein